VAQPAAPDRLGGVIVATHYWSPGWASALDDYLRPRADFYQWIGLPLFADGSRASCKVYRSGILEQALEVPGGRGPLRYAQDVLRTVRWARRQPAAIFVAGDNLLALAGLWLRWRGRVNAVVLYTIDFVPQRFRNRILNFIYRAVDRFAVAHVDAVWNTAVGVIEGREQRDPGKRRAPQLVVPIGAYTTRIRLPGIARRRTVAYLGHLLQKQGLQIVIDALPNVLGRYPEARLLVIGDGPYRQDLEQRAAALEVSDAVEFAGFSDDHAEIERRLVECSIGVAPYEPGDDNYSRFQDLPGKIVTYLACGLAVVTTTVPRDGHLVDEAGAGRVVEYSPRAMGDAICAYFDDPVLLANSQDSARKMASAYDWSTIFGRAFAETIQAVPRLREEATQKPA
jgi:glycosyltransferase involved in cell wall biosynthesis